MTNIDTARLLASIEEKTTAANLDNIRRTMAYQAFYEANPEIRWSFLASMVSRNAGWNMTDLQLDMFQRLLPARVRKQLFSLYERANWLIFSDAYPQLLLYEAHKKEQINMIDHLRHFRVSAFMEQVWRHFIKEGDGQKLLYSLIINEQHVIGSPVIVQSFYKEHVFSRWPYRLQDLLRLNAVFFPTLKGELYGLNAHHFTSVDKRIQLGKKLSALLFDPKLHDMFLQFAKTVPHSGSREDYEQYCQYRTNNSKTLRKCYKIIRHEDTIRPDWYHYGGVKQNWLSEPNKTTHRPAGALFYWKRSLMNRTSKLFKRKSKAVD
ncbi:Protein of unknown function [Terribacillus aidingensis]|uniref:DUF2515 domain-containing protein n=1 Tax=Terribacillus aidingensis TaxID=586416 RepID=A0A285NLG3_9BACI|nr:DUF2515 family protein [Terribacillus aidingensis]SNZ10309.1 Protein of unknown function [Terribacillus aidingensis]